MSTAKRSRRRQTEASPASPPPAAKRIKTTRNSHVPAQRGLGFLVDEDARNGRKLEARLTNGVPSSRTSRVDESHAVVESNTRERNKPNQVGSTAQNAIGISSGEEDSEESSDDDEDEDNEGVRVGINGRHEIAGKPLVNGYSAHGDDDGSDAVAGAEDVQMEEQQEDEPKEETEEPSFGDMLQARHPDAIDVRASFPDPMANRQALIPTTSNNPLSAPSGTSLVTVLTQALKTNDKDLLESCFQTTDLPSIRTTIERLPSQHVATMLQRLAERIYKRPGRTGNLLVWIQWSLVAHGAYLASQPEVMEKLKALSQVIRERANGLQPLLHLKGKLDMLSAQLELRRSMQAASRAANAEDEDDEEGVVYVEGQDDDWSDSEAEATEEPQTDGHAMVPAITKSKPQMATPRTDTSDSEAQSESDDDDMPNGVAQEPDDSQSNDDEDDEGMFDIEAEETSDDDGEEGDSNEEAESEPESEEEVDASGSESDDSGVKQPKPSTLNRKR